MRGRPPAVPLATLALSTTLSLGLLLAPSLGAQTPVPAPRPSPALGTMQFASALGVDLTRSERVTDAVYRRDLTVGTGDELRVGAEATLRLRTYRADGFLLSQSHDSLAVEWYPGMFTADVERALRGIRVGGHRQLVLATGSAGNVPTPAAVVIDVEVLAQK